MASIVKEGRYPTSPLDFASLPNSPLSTLSASSNEAIYDGIITHKQSHYYSRNPPTAHPVDEMSLRTYRLNKFLVEPDSACFVPETTRTE
ncbi:uncharacterized protein F4817DRAFT_28657 [Daldinia loculata]|uniref:uncharacterized protein n=1 Tax=Daldinia loculata TaxID=103429 RepID=UPI0020C4F2C6|nr:uncharacterized protein F4817DRAFT_28657 [Daldinia loculata]KAI1641870.1 hypothetical protein F4817DRAFT_28657 [Daldinia loculata]